MIYELREYVAVPGQREKLHDRFAEHTLRLFDRHNLNVVGFWVDEADPDRVLYLLSFPDDAARQQAWQAFQQDPEWQRIKAESEEDGPIVAEMTSRQLRRVPYWTRETAAGAPAEVETPS